jgi:cellulose synthase/poly-beta-1,6-N-acetylglucosamine synthase-like glycosyltransferase
MSEMSALDVYALILLVYFIASARRAMSTLVAYSRDAEALSDREAECLCEKDIYVLVPLFHEANIVEHIVRKFSREFASVKSIIIHFCVHEADISTLEACKAAIANCLESNVKLVINHAQSHSKASQLNAAIELLRPELTGLSMISVFDADSLPDRRMVNVLRQWRRQAGDYDRTGALQQPPFYPIASRGSPLMAIAQGRAIHSLVYHYCYEQPAYRATCRSWPLVMSVHLTGHGEHLPFRALEAAGGFREPSCDSSLGFALSYLGFSIVPVPIPDVSQTPQRLKDIWEQGVRWYRGCDLYWRELRRLGMTISRLIKASLTLVNNLRWFMIWPATILALMLSWPVEPFHSKTLLIAAAAACYGRHILMYFAYGQLANMAKTRIPLPGLASWLTTLFLSYAMMRVIWSLVPYHYYLNRLLRRDIGQASTPKDDPARRPPTST